jgi:FKBP12-rapamycin complex-associated protein
VQKKDAPPAAVQGALMAFGKLLTPRILYLYLLFTATKFTKANCINVYLGELLTMGAADYMVDSRYREICDFALKYKEHKDKQVKRTVMNILPVIAGFSPQKFAGTHYLKDSVEYLLNAIGNKKEKFDRATAFEALGKIAVVSKTSLLAQISIINRSSQGKYI